MCLFIRLNETILKNEGKLTNYSITRSKEYMYDHKNRKATVCMFHRYKDGTWLEINSVLHVSQSLATDCKCNCRNARFCCARYTLYYITNIKKAVWRKILYVVRNCVTNCYLHYGIMLWFHSGVYSWTPRWTHENRQPDRNIGICVATISSHVICTQAPAFIVLFAPKHLRSLY